jgi:hypothetical protein
MSVVGPLWHPGVLEDAVLDTLKTWLPSYLSEACAQETERLDLAEPKRLAVPKTWATISDYDRFPEQGLPAIIVAAPGMKGEADRRGDGSLRGTWMVEVSATVSADTAKNTRRAAQIYLAAILGSVLQRRSLGDPHSAATFVATEYVDVPNEKRRSIVACAAAFEVQVGEMLSTQLGPATPEPPDPMPETWPEVQETTIETEIQ